MIRHTEPCLITDNQTMLLQGVAVLSALPPGAYFAVDERCLGGSIGGHVRHCVEFYRTFLAGLDTGLLDYDARARELLLETDTQAACDAMRRAAESLITRAGREELGRKLRVIENGDGGRSSWTESSVGRELSFLLSHTVHHYALIAVFMRLRGLELPEFFGVAPSTLRHRAQKLLACQPCAQ